MDTPVEPKYKIIPGYNGWFRVLNCKTGDESALYSLNQCQDIKAMAERGELQGSFNLLNIRSPSWS